MFVLHGKGIRCGIKLATIPPAPATEAGVSFLPFPPVQTVTLNLGAGLQPVIQLGTYPLRDIVRLFLQPPADVTISCLLAEDYPFYNQLMAFFHKDVLTKHYPLADLRIGLGNVFHDGRMPVIDLCAGVARSINIKFGERYATIDFAFVFPIGAYLPNASPDALPPYFVSSVQPARRVTAMCSIATEYGIPFFPFTSAAVSTATFSAQLNTNLGLTMPNIFQALFGSTVLPTSTYSIYNEGAPQYTANITLLLPPEADIPSVFTLPERVFVRVITEGGVVVELRRCEVQSVAPSISHDAPIQFNLAFLGLDLVIRHI